MEIQPGMFKIGDVEEIFLSGTYGIKLFFNKNDSIGDVEMNISNQEIYDVGNILYRTETKNIDELIDVFARYTYDPCSELDLDFSVASNKIMGGGTICPARKVLFAFKGKVFVAFGRYIFGYNYTNEIIKRVGADEEDSSEDSDCTDVDNESNEIVKCVDADNVKDSDGDLNDSYDEYFNNSWDDEDWKKRQGLPDLVSNDLIQLNGPDAKEKRFKCHGYYYSLLIYDQETLAVDAFGLYW